MIWTALDVPPPWTWVVIVGLFAFSSVIVFWLSFTAYHRRYFSGKAIKLALLRTIGWLILNGGAFWLLFTLVSLIFPSGSWLPYLVGSGAWWLLSQTVLALGMKILDQMLVNW